MENKVGRPRKFASPEDLEKLLNEYFEGKEYNEITLTGLCLFLDINKDTFYEYAKRDEFKHMLDMARLRIENSYEIALRKDGGSENIFALKNFGWKEKQEMDIASNIDSVNVKVDKLEVEQMERVKKIQEKLFKDAT